MRRKRTARLPIRDIMDNLPDGLCYFDRNGILILCNRTMYRLVYELTGRELQNASELESILRDTGVGECNDAVYLPDGTAWRFSVAELTGDDGSCYTEYIATDVTELIRRQTELERENRRLKNAAKQLRLLSANTVALTREEETLALKMQIHDRMGRCLAATGHLLSGKQPIENAVPILNEWRQAISLLEQAGEENTAADFLTELKEIAGDLIRIRITGTLPKEPKTAYLIGITVRECAVNAVRHADATELYVSVGTDKHFCTAVLTDNGKAPKSQIVFGGGLSSLKRRIERAGGTMSVRSLPQFSLTVQLPAEQA